MDDEAARQPGELFVSGRASLGALLAATAFCGVLLAPATARAQSSSSDFTEATRYDDAGRIVGTISADPDGAGGNPFLATRNTYDGAGRLTRVETGSLSAWQSEDVPPSTWSTSIFSVSKQVDFSYDGFSRKTKQVVSAAGAHDQVTEFSYDALDRLECTAVRIDPAYPNPSATTACILSTSGGAQPDRITRNVYDATGRLVTVQKALGVTAAVGFPQTLQQDYATYTYSDNGKPLTVKDANGNVASYTYDGLDRLVAWAFPSKTTTGATAACTIGSMAEANDAFGVPVSGPAGGSVSGDDCEKYSYDRDGNRAKLVKRDGRTLAYKYDALNRVTVKAVPDGCAPIQVGACPDATATRDVYYGYDLRGLQTYARFDGASGADAVLSGYDGFGRLVSSTTAMYGISRTLSYEYDADGGRGRLTYPDGVYALYSRDGLDRLKTIFVNGSSNVIKLQYDPNGRLQSLRRGLPGGLWGAPTNYSYDNMGRISALNNDMTGSSNDVTFGFTYNPANQVLVKTRDNSLYVFANYQNVSRSYAANGLNQYISAGPASFSYDANGNLTGDGTDTYGYDAENRLVTASHAGAWTLDYDPLGRLWRQTQAGVSGGPYQNISLYDGDALVGEYDAAGNQTARYIHGDSDDDPMVAYASSSVSAPGYLYADQQGSIIAIADAAGNATHLNTYDEYGVAGAANAGRFQYTGQAWLGIGMYYYKARIYSPTLGRFLQTDPVGYADQNNLYAYVGNDPINGRDPSGMCNIMYSGPCLPEGWPESRRIRSASRANNPAVSGARPSPKQPDNSERAANMATFLDQAKQAAEFAKKSPGASSAMRLAADRAMKWAGGWSTIFTFGSNLAAGKSVPKAVANTAGQSAWNSVVVAVGAAGGGAAAGYFTDGAGARYGAAAGGMGLSYLSDRFHVTSGAGELAEQTLGGVPNEDNLFSGCTSCQEPAP